MDSNKRREFAQFLAEYEKQVDLTPYLSDENFSDLYHLENKHSGLDGYRDLTFYQAGYYIRMSDCFDSHHHLIIIKEGLEDALKEYVVKVNADVAELYEEFIRTSVDKCDEDTFRYWYRVGVDFGICHLSIHARNGYQEMLEEMETEYVEDEPCSRCRGGGCPMCEPHRFI